MKWKDGLEVTLYCYITGMSIIFYLIGLVGLIVHKMDILEWILIGIVFIIIHFIYIVKYNMIYKLKCFINELKR